MCEIGTVHRLHIVGNMLYSLTHGSELLCLPNEIILQIVQGCLEHEDLENFSNCCKHVRCVSASVLASHFDLKKKFSTLAAGDLEGYGLKGHQRYSPHLASLIVDVLHNADIARYARKLILGPTIDSDNWYYCEDNFAEDDAIRLLQDNREALRACVTCLPRDQTLDGWTDEVCNGDLHCPGQGPFYNSILLDLLPHLQVLVLAGQAARHVPFGVEDYIEVCTGSFEGDVFPRWRDQKLPSALNSLREVTLVGSPGSRDIWFSRLYKMALLPNLRTLRGHAVGSSSIIAARYDRGDRELEHLHLTTSEADSEDLLILLHSSKPNSLKTFEYEVGDESVKQVEWQPYKITDVVASCARDSLDTFRFVEGRRAKRVERDGCRSFMGSLVCFSRLKHIHVECHMLIDRYNASRDHMDSFRHNLGAASVGDASETSGVGRSIVN